MTVLDSARGAPRHRDRLPVVVLVVASVVLAGSVAMAVLGVLGRAPWQSTSTLAPPSYGMSGGHGGMMAGHVWLAGDGQPVTTIAQARERATTAGATNGLHPGEVVQFTNNFYVELKDSNGAAITEVLVDPASGAVQTEPGPAMMWNTGARTGTVSEAQARQAATDWLASNRPGESVTSIDAYPGYYTIDTMANGKVAGMLSVNATTGAVWYHTWHGSFIAMEDA